MVVIRVPAFVAAASAAAEAVVPAVLLLRCSLPAQRHRHLRPGGAAADPAGLPLLLRRRLRLRRRRPEAAAGLPVGMAAVAASGWRLPQAAYAKHGCCCGGGGRFYPYVVFNCVGTQAPEPRFTV